MSNPLIAWLDALAHKTGIPKLGEQPPPHYHLRWWPLISLVPAILGMTVVLADPARLWLGYSILMVGFATSMFFSLYGPIKRNAVVERVDEWDRTVRQRAYFFTFRTISIVAWLGIVVLLALSVIEDWSVEVLRQTLMPSAFFLMTLYSTLPTLHASWTTRPIDAD